MEFVVAKKIKEKEKKTEKGCVPSVNYIPDLWTAAYYSFISASLSLPLSLAIVCFMTYLLESVWTRKHGLIEKRKYSLLCCNSDRVAKLTHRYR